MKRKITLLYAFISVLIFIAGCKKGNTDNTLQSVYLPHSRKIYVNGTLSDSITYKYDASNRILETVSLSGTDDKYIYDSNGILTEYDSYTNGTLSSKDTYTYSSNSNQMTYTTFNSNGTILTTINIPITLDGNQRVVKTDYGSNNYDLYTYDALGNQATVAQYHSTNTTVPYYLYTNTYDTNKGVFLNVKGYFSNDSYNLKNNIIKQVVNSVNSPNTPYTFNFTYIYNADGYPTSITETSIGITSSPLTSVYTYTIK